MFDTTKLHFNGGPVTHNHRHEVHEHRAPTDDSVRLLREMEATVNARVLKSMKLDDNKFKCVVQMCRHPQSLARGLQAYFMVNGEKYKAEYFDEYGDWDLIKAVEGLIENMGKEIATTLLVNAISKTMDKSWET